MRRNKNSNNLILSAKSGGDRYFNIFVMNADGSGEKCLTCDKLPKHNGNPAWHPSGKYIVFTVEKKENPYWQKYIKTELWIMDADGNNKRRLSYFHQEGHQHYFKEKETDITAAADSAWSPDGKSIIGLVVTGDPNTDERDNGRVVMIKLE